MAVIRAYVERIKEVNPLINAVVEERFEAALQDAKNVDYEVEVAQEHGTVDDLAIKKPLLGVPLTVKESCCVKGYHCRFSVLHSRYNRGCGLKIEFIFPFPLSDLI